MTYQDIRGIKDFDNKTVIAIKAPPETKLEVPDPKEVRMGHLNYKNYSLPVALSSLMLFLIFLILRLFENSQRGPIWEKCVQ